MTIEAQFDLDLVPEGWFDETLQAVGWYDYEFLAIPAGSPPAGGFFARAYYDLISQSRLGS